MASPAPRLETAAQTLAAVLPTAFVLVDRVRRGQGTPTDWSTSLWRGLAPAARQALTRLAPALDRGIGLREYLLATLPAGHAGHTDWPSLRRFLSGCPDRDLVALVDTAADAQIAWYRHSLEPDPDIEVLLDRADRRGRSVARVARVDAALRLWGVADPVHLAAWVADPEWLRDELVTLLDGLWSAGLARTWRERRTESAVVAAGGGPRAWVTQVTGLRPDADIADALDRADRVICSPCPGLGTALSVTEVDGTAWVLYEPAPEPDPVADTLQVRAAQPSPAPVEAVRAPGRSGSTTAGSNGAPDDAGDVAAGGATDPGGTPAVGRVRGGSRTASGRSAEAGRDAEASIGLAELAATVTALGDPTRIALLSAIGAGHRTAGRLATELGISLSTVSRQIATLERAGLVRVTRADGIRQHELARDAVRALCRALERQLG